MNTEKAESKIISDEYAAFLKSKAQAAERANAAALEKPKTSSEENKDAAE